MQLIEPTFLGRERELDALAAHLLAQERPFGLHAAIVLGHAGAGKSAFVREFARRHEAAFPAGVHFTSRLVDRGGREPRALVEELESLLDRIGPDGTGLIVVEDVDEVDPFAFGATNQVLWKGNPRTRVIITSREAPVVYPEWFMLRLSGLPGELIESLLRAQVGLRGEDLQRLAAAIPGSPLLATMLARMIRDGASVDEVIARIEPVAYAGLLGPDGLPLDPAAQLPGQLGERLRAVSVDLVSRVERDPDRVYELTPRQFEEFVAEIYSRQGFEVELTPETNDGGFDIYAVRHEAFGRLLTLVECKRYGPDNRVGVGLVRQLRGAIDDVGASAGVIATTSSFTKGAKELQGRHEYRLSLQDWLALQEMMKSGRLSAPGS